jgi:hypothetical protein
MLSRSEKSANSTAPGSVKQKAKQRPAAAGRFSSLAGGNNMKVFFSTYHHPKAATALKLRLFSRTSGKIGYASHMASKPDDEQIHFAKAYQPAICSLYAVALLIGIKPETHRESLPNMMPGTCFGSIRVAG